MTVLSELKGERSLYFGTFLLKSIFRFDRAKIQLLQTSKPHVIFRLAQVCSELPLICFHGQAALSKPYITKHNTKCQMHWCKARLYRSLKQWNTWSLLCLVWQCEPEKLHMSDSILPCVTFPQPRGKPSQQSSQLQSVTWHHMKPYGSHKFICTTMYIWFGDI